MEPPHITLFSTPLVSTWVFDETHRVLFDAGDGVAALLDSRIHKSKLVAITHSHRDHCAGLMQLLNLRGGAGDYKVVYPEGSGSSKLLQNFLTSFDSRSTSKVNWHLMAPGTDISIQPDRHFLRGFETDHYPPLAEVKARSLGYQIYRHVNKIKPEYRNLPQQELDALRKANGREFLTDTIEDILFTVSGDTLPLNPEVYRGTRVLLHEATFMERSDRDELANRGNPHTCLEEALEIARDAEVGRLGIYHISRRYDEETIRTSVREWCAKLAIKIPVSVAYPGKVIDNLFGNVVWNGEAEL